jgi:hypothetical protein
MHELLDALAFLFDVLLSPFAVGSEPRKKWIKITGLLIIVIGFLACAAVLAWAFLAPVQNNS